MPTTRSRRNRAPLNLAMGVVGLLATAALLAAYTLEWHMGFRILSVLTLLVSLAVMFATRRSDEYTFGLWSAGANAAFFVIVALLVFGPFIEGVIDGFMQSQDAVERKMDLSSDIGGYGALLAFFTVFNLKRLRGGF